MYAFGDGACTTTGNPDPAPASYFYGKRFTNGRVWLEVLAQRQGLLYESNKNRSYYGHFSPLVVADVNGLTPPPDANTALFVVWISDADFVNDISNYGPGRSGFNLATWTTANNLSLTNHFNVITNLYAKGARTLLLPSAVDITKIPYYNGFSASDKSFIRQRIIDFNTGFASVLNQVRALHPDLTMYNPDFFSLLDDLVTNSANYKLIKPATDAVESGYTALNGTGTNYVFWDQLDPTAKVHMIIADAAQQLVSPPRISGITPLNGSNRLDMVNLPIGRDGFVLGSANLVAWPATNNFSSLNSMQSISLPASSPQAFYRLCFPPAVWTWP